MKKYVALFDWDYTIQKSYAFTTWSNLLISKGIVDGDFLLNNEILLNSYREGKINHNQFADKGMQLFSKYLDGVKTQDIKSINDEFKNLNDALIYPIMKEIIFPILKENEIDIIIISGSPQEALELYKNEFGIKSIFAMNFDKKDEKYLGTYQINTGTSESKEKIIEKITATNDVEVLFAFGDSISDIPLLKCAQCSFVNNSKRFLEKNDILYLDFEDEKAKKIITEKTSEFINNKNHFQN